MRTGSPPIAVLHHPVIQGPRAEGTSATTARPLCLTAFRDESRSLDAHPHISEAREISPSASRRSRECEATL